MLIKMSGKQALYDPADETAARAVASYKARYAASVRLQAVFMGTVIGVLGATAAIGFLTRWYFSVTMLLIGAVVGVLVLRREARRVDDIHADSVQQIKRAMSDGKIVYADFSPAMAMLEAVLTFKGYYLYRVVDQHDLTAIIMGYLKACNLALPDLPEWDGLTRLDTDDVLSPLEEIAIEFADDIVDHLEDCDCDDEQQPATAEPGTN